MKKIKFEKKLGLKKEVVAKLNNEEMNGLKGGNLSGLNTTIPSTTTCTLGHCY